MCGPFSPAAASRITLALPSSPPRLRPPPAPTNPGCRVPHAACGDASQPALAVTAPRPASLDVAAPGGSGWCSASASLVLWDANRVGAPIDEQLALLSGPPRLGWRPEDLDRAGGEPDLARLLGGAGAQPPERSGRSSCGARLLEAPAQEANGKFVPALVAGCVQGGPAQGAGDGGRALRPEGTDMGKGFLEAAAGGANGPQVGSTGKEPALSAAACGGNTAAVNSRPCPNPSTTGRLAEPADARAAAPAKLVNCAAGGGGHLPSGHPSPDPAPARRVGDPAEVRAAAHTPAACAECAAGGGHQPTAADAAMDACIAACASACLPACAAAELYDGTMHADCCFAL